MNRKRLRIKKKEVAQEIGVEKVEIGSFDGFFGGAYKNDVSGILEARFIVPPFSIFDSKQGYWQKRKREWLSLGIKSELGRGEMNPGSPGDNRHDPAAAYQKKKRLTWQIDCNGQSYTKGEKGRKYGKGK